MKKKTMSIAAAATLLIAGGSTSFAAGLPSYESNGMPISSVQLQALGAATTQEQSPAANTTATPHQLGVLTPRKKLASAGVASGKSEAVRAVH